MLARVRDMNRLECVAETMRFTLNSLATLLPDWLARQLQPEWAARYGEHQKVWGSRVQPPPGLT